MNFNTLNRFVLGILLIITGVMLIDTLMEWEYLFRYYGIGGWTTSRVIARLVPAFILSQGVLVLTDKVRLWPTIFLFSIPVVFSFLVATHPTEDVYHYPAEDFGSEVILLIGILVLAGLSVFQSLPNRKSSRIMNILTITGIIVAFTVVGVVQPIFPYEYDDASEQLPSDYFDELEKLDEDTRVFTLFGQGCMHCVRAAQKLYLMHRDADELDRLQFFFPGDSTDPEVIEHNEGFMEYTKTKADYATIDGRLFGQLNGKYIPGIYMRTDSNTFVAWRGDAFNMQALETIEEVINR